MAYNAIHSQSQHANEHLLLYNASAISSAAFICMPSSHPFTPLPSHSRSHFNGLSNRPPLLSSMHLSPTVPQLLSSHPRALAASDFMLTDIHTLGLVTLVITAANIMRQSTHTCYSGCTNLTDAVSTLLNRSRHFAKANDRQPAN